MTDTANQVPGQRVGRPRDASIDERVFTACRELLLEVGWEGLSLRQVAARAGVSRTSTQLRWSSKAELVLHSILGQAPDLRPFEGADRAGWIAWVAEGSNRLFAQPEVRAALPGLLVALQADPALRNTLWRGFSGPAISLYAENSPEPAAAERDGEAILLMAAGAALFSTVIATDSETPEIRAHVSDLLARAAGVGRQTSGGSAAPAGD